MRSGWPTKTLAEVCEVFADGDWIESKDQSPDGIRLIQTGNIGVGVFKNRGRKARHVSEDTFKRLRCTEIFEGDCLISRLPEPVGRSCLMPQAGERMITAVDCSIVRFNPKQLLPEFFNYFSQSCDYLTAVDARTTGTTRKRISRSRLGQTAIPVPSISEQRRIVGMLDEEFEGIARARENAEKNFRNARAVFESHLQSVFTQRREKRAVRPIGEVAKHSLGKMLDKAKNRGEPRPYLRNFNVRWFGFDLSDVLEMRFLPEEEAKYTAVKGDLLICEGGYPGRAAIWPSEEPVYFQKAVHRVRFHEPAHAKWFLYYLYAQDVSGKLKQHFSGTGIQHFTGEALARYSFPLPPLAELQHFVEGFERLHAETRRLACLYERKIAALTELEQSLLHRAFSGQLGTHAA